MQGFFSFDLDAIKAGDKIFRQAFTGRPGEQDAAIVAQLNKERGTITAPKNQRKPKPYRAYIFRR
ncbi:MAG: hypothetical protein HC803_07545 [Saprospiraceae bacterium]|nr:hypothetical protein [Saprospiraceae bacterium]